MERVISIEHQRDRVRGEQMRVDRLRHRRAAERRCVRSGLLRQCRPVEPGRAK